MVIDNLNRPKQKKNIQCHETYKKEISNMDRSRRPKSNVKCFVKGGCQKCKITAFPFQ